MGPIAGGLLIHAFGWRSIFFINLPIGLLLSVVMTLIATAISLWGLPKG